MITEARSRRQLRVVTCYLLLCHMSLISSVQSSPAKTALIGVISLELRSNCGGLCIVDEAEPHWELFQWLIIFQSDLFYYLFTFLKTHFTGSETRTADMNIGTGAGCGGHRPHDNLCCSSISGTQNFTQLWLKSPHWMSKFQIISWALPASSSTSAV